jgi:hypothetical protein
MLTSKDLVLFLAALLLTLSVVIVQRRRGKANRGGHPATITPPPANFTSGTKSDGNKDRRPGGE